MEIEYTECYFERDFFFFRNPKSDFLSRAIFFDLVQDRLKMSSSPNNVILVKEGEESEESFNPTHTMWKFHLHKNFFEQLWCHK